MSANLMPSQPGISRPLARLDDGSVRTSGEEAIRHSKASESVVAAFQAEGFPNPPPGLAAIVTDHVNSATKNIPLSHIANASPGTGPLGAFAMAGVNMLVGNMTPQQREAMKAGVNPLDANAVHRFTLLMGSGMGMVAAARGEGGVGGNNGGRFASLRDSGSGDARQGAPGGLVSAYNSLLREGYRSDQLNQAMHYAKELGWHDRQSLRNLADTGPAGGELAKKFEDARKRGDKAEMDKIRQEAGEKEKTAKTGKERRGWKGLGEKFEKLDAATPQNKVQTESEQTKANPQTANDQKALLEALRKRRAKTPTAKPGG
jgi:hypothetical protein